MIGVFLCPRRPDGFFAPVNGNQIARTVLHGRLPNVRIEM